MISEFSLYWILKLDDICRALFALSLTAFAISMITGFIWGVQTTEGEYAAARTARNICKKSLLISVILFSVYTFIPTTKQIAAIKVIPAITNSDIASELSEDAKSVYRLGVQAIKDYLTTDKQENQSK